jgi:hypothetical protein
MSLLGTYLKKSKSAYSRDTCTSTTKAKIWKQRGCPSPEEWIKEMCYIHPMEFYSAIMKNEITSLQESGDYHLKLNKPDSKKQNITCFLSFVESIFKKKKT